MPVSYFGPSLEVDPANDIFRLASSVYSTATLLPASTLSGWYKRNQEVFCIPRDSDELVAYMTLLPLSQEAFAATLEPQFDEKRLSASDVLCYSKDGTILVLCLQALFILIIGAVVCRDSYAPISWTLH